MAFDTDGGLFTLDMARDGLWEIRVPWVVAIEGWHAHTGSVSLDQDDLRKWLADHQWRFADMIAARVDTAGIACPPDDPRVTAFRLFQVDAAETARLPARRLARYVTGAVVAVMIAVVCAISYLGAPRTSVEQRSAILHAPPRGLHIGERGNGPKVG